MPKAASRSDNENLNVLLQASKEGDVARCVHKPPLSACVVGPPFVFCLSSRPRTLSRARACALPRKHRLVEVLRRDPDKYLVEARGAIIAAPRLHNNGRDAATGAMPSNNAVHFACRNGHLPIIKAIVSELQQRYPPLEDAPDPRLKSALRAYLRVPVRALPLYRSPSMLPSPATRLVAFVHRRPHRTIGRRLCPANAGMLANASALGFFVRIR